MTRHPTPEFERASDPSWSAAQVAAVASAEAIAATAAADVAEKAAATARVVVEVATAVAAKAAATASHVAASAALAVAAAGEELNTNRVPKRSRRGVPSEAGAAARAADKVAARVAAVATAAAEAVVEARAVIGEQLVSDADAAADAVVVAAGGAPARPPRIAPPRLAELTWVEELRRALSGEELRLHYQPIISLASGRPVGVEALVRWQHPSHGLLTPAEFMGTAESSDLILRLGAWVIDEACRFAVALRQRGGETLTVAVNLSGRQLSDQGLVETVQGALDAHGCDAAELVFEVTETALVTDMAAAVASLQALTALGAGVAIDDFGTGYSSLLYLKHLSADDLKIDRSFVCGLGTDSHDTAIVASLISMAHNLGVRCIAEGVETEEQLELLTQLGCDLAQGYLFCRPVDASELETWLDQHPTGGVQNHRWVARSPETPRILAMHDNGSSDHTIAAALNAEGNRPPGGVRWSSQRVAQIVARSRA